MPAWLQYGSAGPARPGTGREAQRRRLAARPRHHAAGRKRIAWHAPRPIVPAH